jgi:hypothetical protein
MDSFVYKWINLTLGKIYIGYHKGTEFDGYVCSSSSNKFWEDFNNPEYKWEREILHRGTMKECQLLESKLLDGIDITSDHVYNNRNNLMFNFDEEVRQKLINAANKRSKNPEYIKKLSDASKNQWKNPEHRRLISEKNTGKKHNQQTIEKIKLSRSEQVITRESRIKAAAKLVGKPRPDSVKQAISLARKNDPIITCPHCGKNGKGGAMHRFHFINCKLKNERLVH